MSATEISISKNPTGPLCAVLTSSPYTAPPNFVAKASIQTMPHEVSNEQHHQIVFGLVVEELVPNRVSHVGAEPPVGCGPSPGRIFKPHEARWHRPLDEGPSRLELLVVIPESYSLPPGVQGAPASTNASSSSISHGSTTSARSRSSAAKSR